MGCWSVLALTLGAIWWQWLPKECDSIDNYNRGNRLYLWAVAIMQTWVIWFVRTFVCQFNPSPCLVKVLCPLDKLSCGLLGIGTWLKQRDEVLMIVREQIEVRSKQKSTPYDI